MTNAMKPLGWLLALGLAPLAAAAQNGGKAPIGDTEGGNRVVAVSVGAFHGCGLRSNGGADCWGANGYGQLDGVADGMLASASLPGPYLSLAVGDLHSCGLKANGSVECWGRNGDGQLDGTRFGTVSLGSRAGPYVAVSAGSFHSCGLKADGGVDCWGRNRHGQLAGLTGGNSVASRPGPYVSVSAGNIHSCAVRADGGVDCWGRGDHGQLDGSPDGSVRSVSRPGAYRMVSAGDRHSCAVTVAGAVECWGHNGDGQLSGTSAAGVNVATTPGPYVAVSAGRYHSCALDAAGSVDCWGSNAHGQLSGTPDAGVRLASRTGPYLEVSAGLYNSCAARADGRTECWGAGGPLASGHPHYAQSQVTPMLDGVGGTAFGQITAGNTHTCQVRRDGVLACWGSNNAGEATPPPGVFKLVANGETHACAIAADTGKVQCWGAGQPGAFGSPDAEATFRGLALGPQGISCGVGTGGSGQCWHPLMGQTHALAGPYRSISVGGQQACVVKADGSAECRDGATTTPLGGSWQDVQLGLAHACGLRADGTVACWGDNSDGQTDNVPAGTFSALSVGWNHACATRSDGAVACWGSNHNGQATAPVGSFVQLVAGNTYTCGIRANGVRWCWGDDSHGQAPQVAIAPAELPAAPSGAAYGVQLTLVDAGQNADGDYLPPSPGFAVVGGRLPGGLSLEAGGMLGGVPTEGGTFQFTVEGEDANGFVASRAYSLSVAGGPVGSTCANEGYTGIKLQWCQNVCENGHTGQLLDAWIHRWIDRFRQLPYCRR